MHTIVYRAVLETYSPVNWFSLNVCRTDIRAPYTLTVLGYSTCILNLCAQWQVEDVRNSVKEVDTGFSCPIMECLSTGLLLWRTKVCTAGSWHCISLTVEWLTYWGSLAFLQICVRVYCVHVITKLESLEEMKMHWSPIYSFFLWPENKSGTVCTKD